MTLFRKQYRQVFSYNQWNKAKQVNSDQVSLYLPHPIHQDKHYLHISSSTHTPTTHVTCIVCHDYRILEAIKTDLSKDKLALLTASCLNEHQQQFNKLAIYITVEPKEALATAFVLDLSWCRRMWSLASKAHVIGVTGVYFSVLGGAFCSLGKSNSRYALKAGALAIQQIRLARRLKDPILECKCWLYFAEDLIQLGNIKKANKIIKAQVEFIESVQDAVLTSMLVSVLGKRDSAKKKKNSGLIP